VNLIQNLGMASVAEGVEDAAQIGILQAIGCRFAQGFLFALPVPAHEVPLLDQLQGPRPAPA
jgi:EAL domain-containing protein (putative c-di-GMP-specific phosphodiesterase class I)